jgi:hypothetical protein
VQFVPASLGGFLWNAAKKSIKFDVLCHYPLNRVFKGLG